MDVTVEAVEDVDEMDAAEFVLYGGKGGVGKTTLAAATALVSAKNETPTLVLSTDPAHSLSDTFETEIHAEPEQIRSDIPLYAAELDPEQTTSFNTDSTGGIGAGLFGESDPFDPMGGMPGTDEVAALQALSTLFEDPRFDRIVVDTAPTGHTLRLLALPDQLDSMMEGMMGLSAQFQGLFGDDATTEVSGFSERITRLRTVLRDPARTDFRVVMVPEELSIRETERLLAQLSAVEIPVGTVVVNRIMQDPAEIVETEMLPEMNESLIGPNHTDCPFCKQRWQVQQRALTEAQDIFRTHDVRRVPLLASEIRGEQLLSVVGACLED